MWCTCLIASRSKPRCSWNVSHRFSEHKSGSWIGLWQCPTSSFDDCCWLWIVLERLVWCWKGWCDAGKMGVEKWQSRSTEGQSNHHKSLHVGKCEVLKSWRDCSSTSTEWWTAHCWWPGVERERVKRAVLVSVSWKDQAESLSVRTNTGTVSEAKLDKHASGTEKHDGPLMGFPECWNTIWNWSKLMYILCGFKKLYNLLLKLQPSFR